MCAPTRSPGFTIFFTGLSAAGKSTLANVLMDRLQMAGRPVTLLDGDIVREHLCRDLGFSRRDRDTNILRIGFVAAEVTKHGGAVICAAIAPYKETRRKVRERVSKVGGFLEVYVATPLEVCEARDPKGLYAQARAGAIKNFTGISDPYEVPQAPDLVIDTRDLRPNDAVGTILLRLAELGYIGQPDLPAYPWNGMAHEAREKHET